LKTFPVSPTSYPFVERPIVTIRREFPEQVLFGNLVYLERKISESRNYYIFERVYSGVVGTTPVEIGGETLVNPIDHANFR